MGQTRNLEQTVDFLGFLRSQLNGLQGIPTLCYELIQNADDVRDEAGNPAAERITFDVCDDALWVENDGVFREIDFERMQRISWGNKREEAGTTGAFGIGFVSVYQITDTPEIFSSSRHWVFHPEVEESRRIEEEDVETQFTRFRLPWAFEVTQVRKELRIPPVGRSKLDDITAEISQAVENAALFLKQIRVLEVKRNGRLVRRIEVLKEDDVYLLADGDKTIRWRILRGDFSETAENMRRRYGELIEEKRRATVELAVPETPLTNGLLYAFLPSETSTGLPFHINADFYPSPDRKRILLDEDYKSEWNGLALECAAEILASNVQSLLELFDIPTFWNFVQRTKDACEDGPLADRLPDFWEILKPEIKNERVVLDAGGKRLRPGEVYYPRQKEQANATEILEELGLPIVHPDLNSYQNLLTLVGVRVLRLSHIVDALRTRGLTQRTELSSMAAHLQTIDGWEK
ncbi:MAG: hypothetical protein D6796_07860, partial [Caldilineae bacterium]